MNASPTKPSPPSPPPPTPIHERPLTEMPSDEPTAGFARVVVVTACVLGVMLIAVAAVFAMLYWKAQHR